MSEENTAKITSVVKTKDPRRVEAGKRLAVISKEAKKKKAAGSYTSETANTAAESSTNLKEIGLVVSVVGILVGAVGLYYRFGKKSECENDSTNEELDEERDEKRETKTTSIDEEPKFKTKLDTLD